PPLVVSQAGAMLGQLTLPLALLCVGGSLSFRAGLGADQRACLMWANGFKLVLVPGLAVALLALLGFRGMDLGIPFLLMAAPVATASYVMVVGLGGNDKLAANLVVSSTLLSLLTVSLGLALLRGVGLA
ncbi:MAG: AEC family transporter, partial [Cellvibrionaceae bacterium]|nr:AEC family transporter [Cellvibrionaceae bacterium]